MIIEKAVDLFSSMIGVFSEERARYHMRKREEFDKAVDDARNARFPIFNRDRIALAEQARDRYLVAFRGEFDLELKKLKEGK
jgi:hypothetical protein